MSTAPSVQEAVAQANALPFVDVYLTLTKREHVEWVMGARYWRSQHERAVSRQLQQAASYQRFVFELREHAGLRDEGLRAELALVQVQAEPRETALRGELDLAQARVRDLQPRLFGRKSERSKDASERQPQLPMRLRARHRDGASAMPTDRVRQVRCLGVGHRAARQVPVRPD